MDVKICYFISEWKIKNGTKIERMFDECKSLFSLPDITKWNKTIDTEFIYESSDDSNSFNSLELLNDSNGKLSYSSLSSYNSINFYEEYSNDN